MNYVEVNSSGWILTTYPKKDCTSSISRKKYYSIEFVTAIVFIKFAFKMLSFINIHKKRTRIRIVDETFRCNTKNLIDQCNN